MKALSWLASMQRLVEVSVEILPDTAQVEIGIVEALHDEA